MNSKELKLGIKIEKEHKDVYNYYDKLLKENGIENPLTLDEFSKMVAEVHIKELKNYYTKLIKMEKGAKMKKSMKLFVNKNTGEMFASPVESSSKLFLKAKSSPVGTIKQKKNGKYRIKTPSGWKPYKKGAGKETAKLVVKQDSRKPKEVTPAEQGEAAARSDVAKYKELNNKINSLMEKKRSATEPEQKMKLRSQISELIKQKEKFQGGGVNKYKELQNQLSDLKNKKANADTPGKKMKIKEQIRSVQDKLDTLEKVGSKITTGQETEALAEAGKENIKGIKKWVEDYKQARKYGNVKLAKKLKKDIDSQIKKYNLNRNEIYGKDPEKERIESEIKSRKLVVKVGGKEKSISKDEYRRNIVIRLRSARKTGDKAGVKKLKAELKKIDTDKVTKTPPSREVRKKNKRKPGVKEDSDFDKDLKKKDKELESLIPSRYNKSYKKQIKGIEKAIKAGMKLPKKDKLIKDVRQQEIENVMDDWDAAKDYASKKIVKMYNNDDADSRDVQDDAIDNIKKQYKNINNNNIDNIIFFLNQEAEIFLEENK